MGGKLKRSMFLGRWCFKAFVFGVKKNTFFINFISKREVI